LWSNRQVEDILKNRIYTGVYELGKATRKVRTISPIMEHLRFLSDEEFFEVQELIKKNRIIIGEKRPTMGGSRLLTGLLYCQCGKKFTSQTHTMKEERQNGSTWCYERTAFRCG
jgi:hypothetical protein